MLGHRLTARIDCASLSAALKTSLRTRAARHAVPCAMSSTQPISNTDVQAGCLWDEINKAYNRAQEAGAAYTTATNGELLKDPVTNIEFVLRVSTALRDKPPFDPSAPKKPQTRNPFLPYEEDLWVCHLTPTHTLLLNKFNVVPHHLLVVTRNFVPQEDGLDAGDLEATWKVLQGMQPGGLAFFNCGPESGASQPHKHVQVVPLPYHPSQPIAPPVQPVVDAAAEGQAPLAPFNVQGLPCQAFACTLPLGVTTEQLHEAAQKLHTQCQAVLKAGGSASYNVLMTKSFIMYIPRRIAGGGAAGPHSLNALAFSGTHLVRFNEELEHAKSSPPGNMLAACGFPW